MAVGTSRKRRKKKPAPEVAPGAVTRCEACGNMHHSAAPRISRSPSVGQGVFVLCDRCFKKAEKDSVYRCDRCGNQEASVEQRKRLSAAGSAMWVPLCNHCNWATEWRKRPERVRLASRFTDWAALAAGIALVLLPVLSLPNLHALIRSYHASTDAQALSTRLYVSRLHAEQSFTRARVVVNLDAGSLVPQKFKRTERRWESDGEPLKLSEGIHFGFGPATVPPPGFRELRQSEAVVFNSRGVPVNDVAEVVPDYAVYVTNERWTYAVVVSPAGHIAMWRFEGGTWTAV